MGFEGIDRYLLGDPVSKPGVVEGLLRDRSADPAAAPFYRAFEAVGARAADEAFVALRLVLAGREATDDAVRRLRTFAALARAAAKGDRPGVDVARRREPAVAAEIAVPDDAKLPAVRDAARAAYERELGWNGGDLDAR